MKRVDSPWHIRRRWPAALPASTLSLLFVLNKLTLSAILCVWKFFSNPPLDHQDRVLSVMIDMGERVRKQSDLGPPS